MAEPGVTVYHATLNRWVVKYAPEVAGLHRKRKRKWRCLGGSTRLKPPSGANGCTCSGPLTGTARPSIPCCLRSVKPKQPRRSSPMLCPAWAIPRRITVDKSRSNAAGITEINKIFKRPRIPLKIDTVPSKSLHNMIAQDHRFIKRVTRPMQGFKNCASAAATLAGIAAAHLIRKRQFGPRAVVSAGLLSSQNNDVQRRSPHISEDFLRRNRSWVVCFR